MSRLIAVGKRRALRAGHRSVSGHRGGRGQRSPLGLRLGRSGRASLGSPQLRSRPRGPRGREARESREARPLAARVWPDSGTLQVGLRPAPTPGGSPLPNFGPGTREKRSTGHRSPQSPGQAPGQVLKAVASFAALSLLPLDTCPFDIFWNPPKHRQTTANQVGKHTPAVSRDVLVLRFCRQNIRGNTHQRTSSSQQSFASGFAIL